MARMDPLRFSEPPAPPPQQPLPEKPDAARRATQDFPVVGLTRSDTEKAVKDNASTSPVSKESSQILSLIEALSHTKKELEAQNCRVRELEELLRQERSARESVESVENVESSQKNESEDSAEIDAQGALESVEPIIPEVEETAHPGESSPEAPADAVAPSTLQDTVADQQSQKLLQQLDNMVIELAEMKQQVETFKQRAEKAEGETLEVRKSLSEMIETLRREREQAATQAKEFSQAAAAEAESFTMVDGNTEMKPDSMEQAKHKLHSHKMKEFESAVTSLTRHQRRSNMLENSGPYASMVGVVLIGIGLMAYLNGWQKIER